MALYLYSNSGESYYAVEEIEKSSYSNNNRTHKQATVQGSLNVITDISAGTIITNTNCIYKSEAELTTDSYYDCNYSSRSPQTYNNSWYVREPNSNGSATSNVPKDAVCSRKCWNNDMSTMHPTTMRCNNLPQSAANMVASYGVYQDTELRNADEEDGFVPRNSVYRGIVVNATGGSSVVRTAEVIPPEENSCSWCVAPQSDASNTDTEASCWTACCKPTVLLLILVVLVVIFMLVSGILVYFNCTCLQLHDA
ncbi:hypothetical protein RN001_016421 [Aquatica leii]|uniref:Uncharacterized protein n=1 Tax=Aquatica leii TaxID=1421715 RepID=A0AAN7SBD2_9COLE|nr:hypothetical protein RN001_016421 [Aquatica leii]